MSRLAAVVVPLAIACLSCDHKKVPPARPTIGHISDQLRALAQSTCKGDFVPEEPERFGVIHDAVRARLKGRTLVEIGCPIHGAEPRGQGWIVYDQKTGDLVGVSFEVRTKHDIVPWIDALEQAGLDGDLVAEARKELASTDSDVRKLEGDGVQVMLTVAVQDTYGITATLE
jgi:hypothetical protein